MKKRIVLLVVLISSVAISTSAQLSFGAGAVLGTNAGIGSIGFGVNARVNYALEKFDLSGGVTYFIPSISSVLGITTSPGEINADAHYSFLKQDDIAVYGLGGLNLTLLTASASDGGHSIPNSAVGLGLDLGVGATYKKFFAETKYDTSLAQLALTVGMNF